MATKVISEIESYSSLDHFKMGFIFLFVLLSVIYLTKNMNINSNFIFSSSFNYTEGLDIGSDVVIAGIKVGEVTQLKISNDKVFVHGYIKNNYPIPSDSILAIRSNGIFGKKSLLIEPGFNTPLESGNYTFINTKDSYSIDMFLRYLNNLNE